MTRSCVMMKFLLFIILTQYAVKCDDTSNYYVIEMPEDDPPRDFKRQFRVYWNVPTMQCMSKKIPFNLEDYGIIQNKNDRFKGEKITILYDPGLFPALLKNDSSGELKFRNGGVPQEGDINLHLDYFRESMEQSIPDKDFNGVGIIDFESWRPIFRQNFGVLVAYKDVSYEVEKKLHWWWPKEWIQAEAKQRYESAARAFMQTTLSIAKQMRPKALWGYYGFPYCFNMGANNLVENCSDNVKKENDNSYWLWAESSALFPSVYSSRDLSTRQLASLIRGRVREALRVRRKLSMVLPYFWFRYREGGYMSQADLSTALQELYKSNASGIIIWGSSNDVNTVDKCMKLLTYVQNILGPAIAKYTKHANSVRNDEMTVPSIDVTSTFKPNVSVENDTVVNTRFIPIDPKIPWSHPKNYSQEISHFVEEELIKKGEYNETEADNKMITSLNESLLIEIIMNGLLHSNLISNINNSSSADSFHQKLVSNTTQLNAPAANIPTSTNNYNLITEQPFLTNLVTKNPLEHVNVSRNEEITSESNLLQTTEYIKEVSESEIPITLTNSDNFHKYDTEEILISSETLFDPKDVKLDTTEDKMDVTTTEYVSIVDITDDNLDSTTDITAEDTVSLNTDKTDVTLHSITDDNPDVNTNDAEHVNTNDNTDITKVSSIDFNMDYTTDINTDDKHATKDTKTDSNTYLDSDLNENDTTDITKNSETYVTTDPTIVTIDENTDVIIDGKADPNTDNTDVSKESTTDSAVVSTTAEYSNPVTNYPLFLNNDDILDNLEDTTENEETFSSFIDVDSTIIESTETGTQNTADFITESTDYMKKFKKEHTKVLNSTKLSPTETDQEVIYIS